MKGIKLKFIFSFIFLSFSLALFAGLRLPSVLSNNLVLQQDTLVKIWGWGKAGAIVKIVPSWSKETYQAKVSADGKWNLSLKTTKTSSKAQQISITSDDKLIIIQNILIGEVWLASGQSNMDFPMAKSTGWRTGVPNADEDIKKANYPEIRIFHVKQSLSPFVELEDCGGEWKILTPDNVKSFSAIAYYFGEELFKNLKNPVGLIQSTWGGTQAEAWTPKSYMSQNTLYKQLYTHQEELFNNYKKDSLAYTVTLDNYEKNKVNDPKITKPKVPKNPNNNQALSTLWIAMIRPLVPYTIKGVIWYQGESNNVRASDYFNVFSNMILAWRSEWRQGNIPFYFVQIAPHYKQSPELREAQLQTYAQIRNTGIVVITDVGDSTDIHPRDKKTPALRLAKWALAEQYGFKIQKAGPIFSNVNFEKDKAAVEFQHVGDGLYCSGNEIKGFEIAGVNGVYFKATAHIIKDKVVVNAVQVLEPKYVRYGWGNFFQVNLFNRAGLPASPFRSSIQF
ncbi:sialate O-acetylesterase [Sphingobacterium bovistauri]|uniref:sialate O-acetylesterase n=1 Tax=Sphingobacterium bovistauri TaxID=2781959 RepID=UPI001CE0BC56|nr:sialate O-acetylesterase [Sphingobacterium bovistauri]